MTIGGGSSYSLWELAAPFPQPFVLVRCARGERARATRGSAASVYSTDCRSPILRLVATVYGFPLWRGMMPSWRDITCEQTWGSIVCYSRWRQLG